MKIPKLEVNRLVTERLILIPFDLELCKNLIENDFDDLLKMGLRRGLSWPDEDVIETLPKIVNNLSKVDWPTGFESWMIIKKDSSEIIGDLGFKGYNYQTQSVDIGYGIIKEERRKGFAEEASREIINWAFSKEFVYEITAQCLQKNSSSVNLLKKLGFKETHKDITMIYWSLSKSRYNLVVR
ncbi:GNAT family N-acetyltransferase [Flavobacterium terrae]|uniref:Ribosomal-protein-alanine N-acetyltransferase n=1 Tax=Flavobacterium terrae TaxID=415425 RepID=A0A1M6B0Z8_9FLAO|nr:GNAT family N-acetyltransferase [Flavobacterium terrae]SHI42390.1 ribosomal-protein-alanine N-acetyltransferase [Flavobacterium terrae]